MLALERFLAALAAEVDRLAVMLDRRGARRDGDGHPAYGVDRGDGTRVTPHLDDPGEDRDGDLLWRARADGHAGRRIDAREQLVRNAVAAQLADHPLSTPATCDEAHVGQAGLEARAQRRQLLATVAGHDERQVARRGLEVAARHADHV